MTRQGLGLIGAGVALAMVVAGLWSNGRQDDAPRVAAPEAEAVIASPLPVAEAPAVLPPEAPRFDVVRVDGDGLATVAGSVMPGGSVSLRVDGAEVAQATADARGQFAAIFTLAPSQAVRILSLVLILPDGTEVAGSETVALAPVAALVVAEAEAEAEAEVAVQGGGAQATGTEAIPAADKPVAPAALLISPSGVTVLQPPTPADPPAIPAGLRIDSISYGAAGEVMIGGHGVGAVRLYLNGSPVADAPVGDDGRWQVQLADVAAGLHMLRADQIDASGKVLARFETPFQREAPVRIDAEAVALSAAPVAAAEPRGDALPVASAAPITITVQPGLTLWAIARQNFGDGVMYVQVFESNRDKIKDPDLIYPGQVFTVPKP